MLSQCVTDIVLECVCVSACVCECVFVLVRVCECVCVLVRVCLSACTIERACQKRKYKRKQQKKTNKQSKNKKKHTHRKQKKMINILNVTNNNLNCTLPARLIKSGHTGLDFLWFFRSARVTTRECNSFVFVEVTNSYWFMHQAVTRLTGL